MKYYMKKLFLIALVTLSLNTFAETDCEKIFNLFINNYQKELELLDQAYKKIDECENKQGTEKLDIERLHQSLEFYFCTKTSHLVGIVQSEKLLVEFFGNKDSNAAFAILRQKVKEACKSKR